MKSYDFTSIVHSKDDFCLMLSNSEAGFLSVVLDDILNDTSKQLSKYRREFIMNLLSILKVQFSDTRVQKPLIDFL